MRGITRSGLPVHGFELLLERVVEDEVPVESQKSEERPNTVQALHHHLLSLREFHPWLPAIHVHLSTGKRSADRVVSIPVRKGSKSLVHQHDRRSSTAGRVAGVRRARNQDLPRVRVPSGYASRIAAAISRNGVASGDRLRQTSAIVRSAAGDAIGRT